MIIADSLKSIPHVRHGFFTREGGRSTGIYEGLNIGLGSDDDRATVLKNRGIGAAMLGLGVEDLALPYQRHSAEVIVVTRAWGTNTGPKADAVVTNKPGIGIGVSSADCGPVLLSDRAGTVVGAAHAGWKGAFGGILESTVETMEALGVDRADIVAVLGPTISGSSYEVGPEFAARFFEADDANRSYFTPSERDGHFMFDLPAYIVGRLARLNLAVAESLDLCTYRDPERFYSYRRATHRGEPDYGRLMSVIRLDPQGS